MEKRRILYILVACEESQAECMAFRALGHEAFSCDIQPCKRGGHPEWHICSDVAPLLSGETFFITQDGTYNKVPQWDLIVAHPPCTYLCRISSSVLYKNADFSIYFNGKHMLVNRLRYERMKEAREFFFKCLDAAAPYVAVENPCPMALAQLPRANAFVCPSWYGSKYTKKTYYWLKNLPPLLPKFINTNTKCLVRCSRGKYRSRTYQGLADALALQWTDYILNS